MCYKIDAKALFLKTTGIACLQSSVLTVSSVDVQATALAMCPTTTSHGRRPVASMASASHSTSHRCIQLHSAMTHSLHAAQARRTGVRLFRVVCHMNIRASPAAVVLIQP